MSVDTITHASALKARIYPYFSALNPKNLDRLQSLRIGWNRPNEEVNEVGEKDEIARDWKTPEVTASAGMLENGSIDIWKVLCNKDANTLTLADFDGKYLDLVAFKRDTRDGSLVKCIYAPYMTVNGFGINIADPDAKIERTFDLMGNIYKTLRKGNKAFCYVDHTVTSGEFVSGDTYMFDLSSYPPVANPDDSTYFFRVSRETSGEVTELVSGTDYSYDTGTKYLYISGCAVGDVLKVSYCGASAVESSSVWSKNTSDLNFIKANSMTAYLVDGATNRRVYKLESLSIGVTFDIERIPELGSDVDILRRVRDKNLTVTLRGKVYSASFDEILRGKAGLDYGVIDITKYEDTMGLIVKCYSDSDKGTFKIGYEASNLKYPSRDTDIPVNDFLSKDITLEGDTLTITNDENELSNP